MNKNENGLVTAEETALITTDIGRAETEESECDEKAIGAYPEEVGETFLAEIEDGSPFESDGQASESLDTELSEDEHRLSGEKEEYRRLIKTRFKDFYQEDTQKLINRRFRKYKELEERHSETEKRLEEANRQLDALRASFDIALERVAKETEERVLNSVRQRHLRPDENGIAKRVAFGKSDVSSLTRLERADIAKRAAGGEKISF